MTTIVRWNPAREMANMQRAFERLDRAFSDNVNTVRQQLDAHTPAFDVHEADTAYTVTTDLPGITADNIDIKFHDNVLTINAELAQHEAEEGEKVLLRERVYGRFTRSLRLPQPIDGDNIEAAFDNGVLTLTLPKSEAAQPKHIAVKAGAPALPTEN